MGFGGAAGAAARGLPVAQRRGARRGADRQGDGLLRGKRQDSLLACRACAAGTVGKAMSNEDDEFTRGVKADLRRMVDDTSPQVRARLDRMVDAAIRGRVPARGPVRRMAWPLGAVAASATAITLALMQWRASTPTSPTAQAPGTPADDVALLLNVDNLDLLEQMEFYLWL